MVYELVIELEPGALEKIRQITGLIHENKSWYVAFMFKAVIAVYKRTLKGTIYAKNLEDINEAVGLLRYVGVGLHALQLRVREKENVKWLEARNENEV